MRTSLAAAATLLAIALAVAWVTLLRPQPLGGSAAYEVVAGESMLPTYASGDLVVVRRREHYRAGDVVAYRVPAPGPGAGTHVLHRVVRTTPEGFVVQGDNRTAADPWRPAPADVVGAAWLHVPRGGYAIALLRSPLVLGTVAAALVIAWVLAPASRERATVPP